MGNAAQPGAKETWNPLQAGAVTITARANVASFSGTTTTAGAWLAAQFQSASRRRSPEPDSPPPATSSPSGTNMDGTKVTIAGIDVPIFSVDSGKITVLIPTELASNTAYQVVVSNNGTVSATDTILIADAAPGLATNPGGTVMARRLDTAPLTADNPAAAGESIYPFGSGFGLAPADEPLARPVNPVTMTADGNSAVVDTVLAPGGIGLYRLQVTVSPDANPGNLTVVVTQNGLKANQGTLPVAVPAAP